MRSLHLLAACAVATCSLALGQTPVRSETGAVSGIVMRAGTGEPIAGAQVRLLDPQSLQALQDLLSTSANGGLPVSSVPDEILIQVILDRAAAPGASNNAALQRAAAGLKRVAVTDQTGRFHFSDIPPGQYTLRAHRDGYFGGTVNNTANDSVSVPVTIGAGRTAELTVPMLQGAVISGRVSAGGIPQVGVTVQAFAISYENGYQILRPAASKATDDRGDYRLFFLPAGEYLVAAVPRQIALRATQPSEAIATEAEQALRTFYPGASDALNAIPLTVRGATEVVGIDIPMQTARTYRVSGEIRTTILPKSIPGLIGPTGAAPVVSASLGFALHDPDIPDDSGGTSINGSIPLVSDGQELRGRFEVRGVVPGSYDWRAYLNENTDEGSFVTTAVVPIEVRNRDVEGLLLEIPRIVRVTGVVTIDDHAPAPTSVRLSLQVEGSSAKRPGYQSIAARVVTANAADGAFMIPGIQNGRYRVMLPGGLPPNLYLADVRQSAASVFDVGFEVRKGPPDPLQVMLRSGAGRIDGVVLDSARKPVPAATVALVPTQSLRGNRARYQTATADANGRFALGNIIPGDYKLFAWEDAPGGAYFNARFLSRYEERGRSVGVGPGSSAVVDLVALSPEGR